MIKCDDEKKTILQVNITCQQGSTGRLVAETHKYLVEKGYDSRIAYSAFKSDIIGSFKIESKVENYLRRALNKCFGKKYSHSMLGTLRLIKNIKQVKPDLIHLHNIQQNSIDFPMLMKFLKKYNVPVVYTLHDCWAFTGGCYHFTNINCDHYKIGCIDCKLEKKQRDINNKFPSCIYEEKKNLLSALPELRIICVSNWLRDTASKSYMGNLSMETIYNGIDTSIFKPMNTNKREEIGVSDEKFVILGVANYWDSRKGLNIFFELAELLDKRYKIVLVGIEQKECPNNITAIERTTNIQELAEIYSCADVLINASKEETFGLVAAESMACGTPVIAYDSTACGEVVNNDTGILLKSFYMEELLDAIDTIWINGKKKYSEKCIGNVKENFSNEIMLKKYTEVYEQLIAK